MWSRTSVHLPLPGFHLHSGLTADHGHLTHFFGILCARLGHDILSQCLAQLRATLAELHADGNKLKQLPPEMGQLSNLTRLVLDDNEIEEVPMAWRGLSKLRTLRLQNNLLKTIPPELTSGLEKLADLRI